MAENSQYRQGDYLLGIEGLALLRGGTRKHFDSLERRRSEIQQIISGFEQPPYSIRRDFPEAAIDTGYTIWADTYDPPSEDDHDPIIQLEQPVMRALMDGLPDGPVLDAGCGTGRHTAYLVEAGREVVGVDPVEAMLDQARKKLPSVDLRKGDLESLPVEDGSFDSVICGLAFSHLPEIGPAIAELARVLRPGGRAIISAPHPFITAVLGWRAPVIDAEGNGSEMPEYEHLHGEYIAEFVRAGFTVLQCIEPRLTPDQAKWSPEGKPGEEDEALEQALAGQPGVFVWEVARS
ncbi:MAG: hypothetical protein QOH58_3469 [Thermoleophilaceae bacterium]|nr:hypothetical protein [Thermoleophilaceae bacterium]